jgi:murein DD-endopeptidase MepM/ murein hydrolase activator NlpD
VTGVQGLLNEELGALRDRAKGLDTSLQQLDAAWQVRARLLASTPSMMPVEGFFSDGYGWRNDPFTGEREFHKGVDIVASTGTEVRATADGIVTSAGRMAGYGKMIHLSHGYGLGTRYGHLNEILVLPGQRVHRGDVIGKVGSTGRSSGPHLHYEVFKGARQVPPLPYLSAPRIAS